jgi:hypothetical protein
MRQHLPDDELRARLARLDPIGDRPVERASGPRAVEQMEHAMQTLETPQPVDDRRRSRRRLVLSGAAALGATAAVAGGVLLFGGDDPAAPPGGEPTTLALDLPATDANAACMAFDEQFLATMPVAFSGTVRSVADNEVVLDVDHWFAGGDAERVVLDTPGETVSFEIGLDFTQGERYLVSAMDGIVNGCGYSGPATPDMEAAYERAFAG